MSDCIFCKIIKGDLPCHKILEDNEFIAFLDINPAAKGHSLVVPKKHVESFLDLPSSELQALFSHVQSICRVLKKDFGSDGFNLVVNNDKSAGQLVPHVHVHIIPRRNEDGVNLKWPRAKYGEGEAERISGFLNKYLNI